jgi:hypothetical protein
MRGICRFCLYIAFPMSLFIREDDFFCLRHPIVKFIDKNKMNRLPDDALRYCCSYLTEGDLLHRFCLVNKSWYSIVHDEQTWAKRDILLTSPPVPNVLQFMRKCNIASFGLFMHNDDTRKYIPFVYQLQDELKSFMLSCSTRNSFEWDESFRFNQLKILVFGIGVLSEAHVHVIQSCKHTLTDLSIYLRAEKLPVISMLWNEVKECKLLRKLVVPIIPIEDDQLLDINTDSLEELTILDPFFVTSNTWSKIFQSKRLHTLTIDSSSFKVEPLGAVSKSQSVQKLSLRYSTNYYQSLLYSLCDNLVQLTIDSYKVKIEDGVYFPKLRKLTAGAFYSSIILSLLKLCGPELQCLVLSSPSKKALLELPSYYDENIVFPKLTHIELAYTQDLFNAQIIAMSAASNLRLTIIDQIKSDSKQQIHEYVSKWSSIFRLRTNEQAIYTDWLSPSAQQSIQILEINEQ